MASANSFPRVTESGVVSLPSNLSVGEANRLARTLRPSWVDVFRPESPEPSEEVYERPAARVSVASPERTARGRQPEFTEPRRSKEFPRPTPPQHEDAPLSEAVVPGTGGGLPVAKMAMGLGALAVAAVAVFMLTRSTPQPTTAVQDTKAGTVAAPTVSQQAPSLTAVAPTAAVPAPRPEPQASALPTPEPSAVAEAPTEAPTAAKAAPAAAVREPTPAAAAPRPRPAPAAAPASPPPAPKTKPGAGGGGIVRDAPF